ncbi:glycoside hydrolase family 12 protein [Sclerotinia borealis F-4128]|uniref:Glycoside hydrolase family 12 protein n=1 Tax=Sclerotinia borealis (strain F-4128) TaxID=1432307 RepID=W9CFU2_SCLBF|nr:glycoside hydrolase family 12 protein [Sclerotinia borealis F-4128]
MKFTQVALPLLFSGAAIAAPAVSKTLKARSTQICGQYDSVATGAYTVYQDLWGKDAASSGSQCSTVESLSGTTIAWSTSWSWAGASSSVKSYANVALDSVAKTGVQVSSIASIPAIWKWGYTGSSIVADVSWDVFTAATSGGTNEYEIMIWLAAIGGAGPISSTGSAIATATIAGHEFKLYSGPNGDTTVYSFVATSEATNFDGDLLDFLTYLSTNEGWSTSQYINVLEAGTEPFTGTDAVFSVSAYSVAISLGSSSAVKAVSSTSTSSTKVAPASTSSAQTHTSTTKAAVAASVTPTSSAKAQVSTTKAAAVSTSTTSSSSIGSVALYGNCTGGLTCSAGSCVVQNAYYSQLITAIMFLVKSKNGLAEAILTEPFDMST